MAAMRSEATDVRSFKFKEVIVDIMLSSRDTRLPNARGAATLDL
jgi:hypothetical protein